MRLCCFAVSSHSPKTDVYVHWRIDPRYQCMNEQCVCVSVCPAGDAVGHKVGEMMNM